MSFPVLSARTPLSPFVHPFPFDPTYGYDLDRLLRIAPPPIPSDFADFWKNRYQRALDVPLEYEISEPNGELPHHVLHDLFYTSTEGQRIGAWLAVPKAGVPQEGLVVGHGYGGRDTIQDEKIPAGAVAIFPCARGLGRSPMSGLKTNEAQQHVVWGLESRDTYVHGACMDDHWCAASVLLKIYPAAARRLLFYGGSFSGGMGALLLPWDSRFHGGHLHVPSFGHHPLRVTLPCEGSGKAVREYWLKQPQVLDVLQYFDAAIAAQLIRIPMFVSCALFDPAVPPPGQFSIYNALTGPKQLCVFSGGHFDHPLEQGEYAFCHQARDTFLAKTI